MGSLPDSAQALRDGMGMDEVAAKSELANAEGSCSDSVSTPEPEGEAAAQEASQRQKRKGGRKPVCHNQIPVVAIYCDLVLILLLTTCRFLCV